MFKNSSGIVLILIIAFSLSLISVNASCKNPDGGTYCGAASGAGNCYCDGSCVSYGDCCADYKSVCYEDPPPEKKTDVDSGCNPTGKTCNEIDGNACVFEHYSNCNGKCIEYCKFGCDGEKAECIDNSEGEGNSIYESDTKTYPINGKYYEVTLNYLSQDSAQFIVNGEVTSKLKVWESGQLSDGSTITLLKIYYQATSGQPKKANYAIFDIGCNSGKCMSSNAPQPPFNVYADISEFDGLKYAKLYWSNVNGEVFYIYKNKNYGQPVQSGKTDETFWKDPDALAKDITYSYYVTALKYNPSTQKYDESGPSNELYVYPSIPPPEKLIFESVKCIFHNSKETQKCDYKKILESGYIALADGCEGIESCIVLVNGTKGQKVEWNSSCIGNPTTIIDGIDEYAEFKCDSESVDEPKAPKAQINTCKNPDGGNSCGSKSKTSNCYCDNACESAGDCCDDYKSICKNGPKKDNEIKQEPKKDDEIKSPVATTKYPGSCKSSCGSKSQDGSCYCDAKCTELGDCCADYKESCATKDYNPPKSKDSETKSSSASCKDSCYGQSKSGNCFCDEASVTQYGDFCKDISTYCSDVWNNPSNKFK